MTSNGHNDSSSSSSSSSNEDGNDEGNSNKRQKLQQSAATAAASSSSSSSSNTGPINPYRVTYIPSVLPTVPFSVARPIPEMKGHTAFLTFAVRPPVATVSTGVTATVVPGMSLSSVKEDDGDEEQQEQGVMEGQHVNEEDAEEE